MRFQGKVAIVTGGSRGIGRAISHALAMEGATVALIARNVETGNEAAAQIGAAGGEAFFLQAYTLSSARCQRQRSGSARCRRDGPVPGAS
jgi:NAD(P)-dependent dehydrogenase (short-subunit alcohol dehydrogenase family)